MVIFLCHELEPSLVTFAKSIDFCEVYILVDNLDTLPPDPMFIQIPDELCASHGYINSNTSDQTKTHIKKNPIAWDKVLYWLSLRSFDKCFILEHDVFVPDKQILKNLLKLDFDLCVRSNNKRIGRHQDWHWSSIDKAIKPPHYYSMVSAVGISELLLNKITNHVQIKKSLFHIEALFNTIANQNQLKVITPKVLSPVVAMGSWDLPVMKLYPVRLYHPVKQIQRHQYYREVIHSQNNDYCTPVEIQNFTLQPYTNCLIPQFIKHLPKISKNQNK